MVLKNSHESREFDRLPDSDLRKVVFCLLLTAQGSQLAPPILVFCLEPEKDDIASYLYGIRFKDIANHFPYREEESAMFTTIVKYANDAMRLRRFLYR